MYIHIVNLINYKPIFNASHIIIRILKCCCHDYIYYIIFIIYNIKLIYAALMHMHRVHPRCAFTVCTSSAWASTTSCVHMHWVYSRCGCTPIILGQLHSRCIQCTNSAYALGVHSRNFGSDDFDACHNAVHSVRTECTHLSLPCIIRQNKHWRFWKKNHHTYCIIKN